jgi:hypothetical protein
MPGLGDDLYSRQPICDSAARAWRKVRLRIAGRKRFLRDPGSITGDLIFPNRAAPIRTMIDGQPPPEARQAGTITKPDEKIQTNTNHHARLHDENGWGECPALDSLSGWHL